MGGVFAREKIIVCEESVCLLCFSEPQVAAASTAAVVAVGCVISGVKLESLMLHARSGK